MEVGYEEIKEIEEKAFKKGFEEGVQRMHAEWVAWDKIRSQDNDPDDPIIIGPPPNPDKIHFMKARKLT